MKKTVFMSAARKARIALAVMALCGMSFVGAQEAFAADVTTDLPVKTDAGKNIICGDGAKAEKATGSTVDPANDIVIGVNAIANDKNSIAIGTGANAKAENSVAIGYGSVADAANTISFGSAFDDSKNKRLVNLAAGTSNNDAATYGQVITSVKQNGNKLEFYTGTNTTKAMDVELNHPINFKGSNLVSNGATIVTDSTVTGNSINNIVIGDYAKASKGYDSGYSRESNPQYNIIIGNSAQAKGVHNIVMGAEATTDGTYGVVLGYKAQSKGEGIAIGAASKATYGVAIRGTAEGSGTIAISNFSVAKGYFNTAIGYSAKATGSESSLALGAQSEASEKLAIAIGSYTKASKEGSIAIGPWAEVSGGISAIGYNAKATGEGSIAYSGTASGERSLALGGTASGKSSYALGGLASGKQSVSIGAGSVAKYDNVVSVGMGEDTEWWNSLPAYRRIVNMADGIANHDAATFGQIIKKDTYTISLDDTGNGNVVLKTNADKEGPTIKVDASALDTQIKQNADAIGTLTNLTTTEKTNLVGAVNEVKGAADAAQTKANDAFTQANTNKASIGTLTNLTTTEKTNLVGAVNEVKGTADTALGLANTNKANIGSLSADGNYIKKGNNVSKNLSALDDKVKENTDAINTKADKDLSNITDAGKNVIKDLAGNKAGEIVDTKLGDITSENYVNKADTVNANISALDKQVKANEGAITAVDNKIGSLNADGNYIKKDNNVSQNLSVLDDKVKENTDAINTKADKDLSNITDAGKNVIKDLAGNKAGEIVDTKLGDITSENYVNKADTVNANISALDKQVKANESAITVVDNKIGSLNADGNYIKKGNNVSKNLSVLDDKVKANEGAITAVDNKIGSLNADGNYIKKDNNVSQNLSVLDDKVKENTDAINTKADKDLSNITDAGKNVIKDLAGNKAGEIVDTKLGDITSENYVNKADTVNANISALDKQVKANADAINTKADKDLSNISDAGKDVIKDLAGNKAGEIVDTKLGDITSENYVNKADTVNANISALDKQMKVNTDNIGDTGKLTAAGLGSNLSDAVVKVNDKVGTADELKVLKDAGLGDNLAQATAAVNKKADKNAEDIKNVNGRVDELGGRVDTLGGAVSKLDTKVNKVGAGAAALAALHPMDFDPDNKLTFAAGVGNYRGANAAAIGAFYRPNEQVMFSIAGNMGNGENMVNAGVSFALDRPSQTPTTKAALVKTVAAQNEQIAALNETVAEQNEKIARLEAMVEKLAAKQNA
ncbi:YadA-like family protein [Phascolarctobacterium succinatutens]|uniref:YadA-like family protein n=1 Tax=Phascolarctobacterium succinatutens TaxID=626940 RepID=UPI00307C9148